MASFSLKKKTCRIGEYEIHLLYISMYVAIKNCFFEKFVGKLFICMDIPHSQEHQVFVPRLTTIEWSNPWYKRKDDWGISWLELFFNFCLCTRRFFPIRIEGRKKDSVYIDFHSDEALLNFGKKRAANMQTLCMERLIRALEKLQQCTLFPAFKSNQCKSLMRFGYAGKHTGIPCRPLMNKQIETMEWVRKFMVKARSEGHLGQTPILPDGQAIIDFPSLTEKKTRWEMGHLFPN